LADICLVDPPIARASILVGTSCSVLVRSAVPNAKWWFGRRPRSTSNSWMARYESENRRYERTAQTMISGSKWRH
jgi:hypothetical protein